MEYRLIAKLYDPAGAEVHPETEVHGSSPEECVLQYARKMGVFVPVPEPPAAVTTATGTEGAGSDPPQSPVTAPEPDGIGDGGAYDD